MKLFVLSPCGTSLLTNGAENQERKLIGKYANVKEKTSIPDNDADLLQARINNVRSKLLPSEPTAVVAMSAELNAIIKLYRGQFDDRNDYHLLLCTDTWLGQATADLVADWLRGHGLIVEIRRQTDLQTADLQAFQLALADMVSWCEQTIPRYRQACYRVIFNLTGGFKSVQGFLQTLAMFYADESIYVFETGEELLRIPRLPVEMTAESTVREHLVTFRRLALKLDVEDCSGLPELLLMQIDDNTCLSPWGDLVWKQSKKNIYAESIFPPPSARLVFGKDFERSISALDPQRKIEINERLDQLARCLETTGSYNPPSLDFKPLQGNPLPRSTHEFDAWADQDAKRIFGHYEGDVFVLDKLAEGLH